MADLNYDVNNPGEPWLPEPPLPPTLSAAETLTSTFLLLSFFFFFFYLRLSNMRLWMLILPASLITSSSSPLCLSHTLPPCLPTGIRSDWRQGPEVARKRGWCERLEGHIRKERPLLVVCYSGVEQFNVLRFAERGCVLEA